MTIEASLYTALKSLVGNRVSPIIFPQPENGPPTWPAIRYNFISNVPVVDMCGDGDDVTSEPRVQLDIVALTFKAVRALRLQVMAAMTAAFPDYPATADVPVAILQNSSSEYDAETQTYREQLDYVFHGSSASGNSPP
jgi:hypothetical protein